MTTAVSDAELHAQFRHPGWEYATTEGPRKAWDAADVPPEGEGWERNLDAGHDGWERFDYTEESYWRRRTPRSAAVSEPCCRLAGTTPHVHGDGTHTKPAGWYPNPDNPDQLIWFDGYRYRPETAH